MKKNENGITLIALVITIVVLLILAGVSISMLVGENGIVTKAQESKEENRGGTVEERRDLWVANINVDQKTDSQTTQELSELLSDLKKDGLLSDGEIVFINENGYIQIGSHFIDFRLDNNEIDLSKLAPGLYKTGTDMMIYSWEELKNNGYITVNNNDLTRVSSELEGDLIISNEIVNIGQESPYVVDLLGSTCGNLYGKITKVYIPSSVKIIYKNAFEGFIKMNEVSIDIGLEKIGDFAFANCYELEKINIPESVIKLGHGIFGEAFSKSGETTYYTLTNLYIPSSVKEIDGQLFLGISYIDTNKIPVIYCENTEKIDTWSDSWNSIYNPSQMYATVKYGYTKEQYKTEIKNSQ